MRPLSVTLHSGTNLAIAWKMRLDSTRRPQRWRKEEERGEINGQTENESQRWVVSHASDSCDHRSDHTHDFDPASAGADRQSGQRVSDRFGWPVFQWTREWNRRWRMVGCHTRG